MSIYTRVFVACLVVCFVSSLVTALQFDIKPRELRCIGQELDSFETVVFATSASSASKGLAKQQKLTLTVSDPDEGTIFDEKISVGAKARELEHKVEKRGVYEMCFELHDGKTLTASSLREAYDSSFRFRCTGMQPVRVFFHVDYKPKTAEGRKVGKDDMSTLSSQLDLLGGRIKDISREIDHARRQEIAMKEAGEFTTWSVQWFSILSIVILLATSLWQIIYLRTFFASKKLL